ncbi:EpsG family protein [Aequorivita sinensis]|uniref:EpsG family protein n=1 Tax=Aequorivita sinensis TaxID=1382458 RepID=UPI00111F2956|nr:EpsG family protein [Aequorivita sinensis]
MVVSILLHSYSLPLISIKTIRFNNVFGVCVFLFVLAYLGLRPIDGVFIDMTTYARQFRRIQNEGLSFESLNDPLYAVFLYLCTLFISVKTFFLICAFLYVVPLYIVCKKWFKEYSFYGFVILITTFTFWAYGINGIRNGIATSLFVFALSRESLRSKIIFFILSIGFHKSMMLPLIGYLLTTNLNIKIKYFFYLWLASIPLSLVGGGLWEQLFASLGFDDERLGYLTDEIVEGRFASTGFRWDFLIFSALPVLFGYFYVYKKKFVDNMYLIILNTYLFANAFWILVIRANFSNRFAYLSWFIMGLVIIYPLLKQRMVYQQHKKIGIILLGYFSFTFLMNVILT